MELSGRTLTAAIFAVVILLIGIWHVVSPYVFPSQNATVTSNTIEKTDTDSDNDGLKDWEEQLIGTNPHAVDSNNDGVTDYEDVLRLRTALTGATDGQGSGGTSANQTVTDTVARDLIGAYASAKRLGTYDASAFADVVATISSEPFATKAPTYTADDLTITTDAGEDAYRAYVSSVQSILAQTDTLEEYELTVFARAVQEDDDASYETLQNAHAVYTHVADELLLLTVPKDAVSTHIALINGFSQFGFSLNHMAFSRTDPALAFPAINAFLEGEDMIKAAFSSLSLYIKLHSSSTS